MPTLQQIINSYKADGHTVTHLFVSEMQCLQEGKILKIIINAKAREIIVNYPEKGILDGVGYKCKGKIDPDFDIEKYLNI